MPCFAIAEDLLEEIENEVSDYSPQFELLSKTDRFKIVGCDGCTGCNPCTGTV